MERLGVELRNDVRTLSTLAYRDFRELLCRLLRYREFGVLGIFDEASLAWLASWARPAPASNDLLEASSLLVSPRS